MKYLLTFTILAVVCCAAYGSYDTAEDCNADQCIELVERVLDKDDYDCLEDPTRIMKAVAPCRKVHCSQAVRNKVKQLGNRIEDKTVRSGCMATEISGGRDCSLAMSFECAMGSANLALILPNLQIQNITKLCIDISSLLQTINVCQQCVQGLIPGWQSWSAEVDYIFNVSVTLGNGACNCSNMIVTQVNSINTSTPCSTVKTVVNFARIIASDCAVKLVNYPLQLDWLDVVDNYINFFLPFTGTFCSVVGGAAILRSSLTLCLLAIPVLLIAILHRYSS